MDLMVQAADSKDVPNLVQSLTGPYRTMGDAVAPEDLGAPAWWHGEEDAYTAAEVAMASLPRRR